MSDINKTSRQRRRLARLRNLGRPHWQGWTEGGRGRGVIAIARRAVLPLDKICAAFVYDMMIHP